MTYWFIFVLCLRVYCLGSLDPEYFQSRSKLSNRATTEAYILTVTDMLTPVAASVASCCCPAKRDYCGEIALTCWHPCDIRNIFDYVNCAFRFGIFLLNLLYMKYWVTFHSLVMFVFCTLMVYMVCVSFMVCVDCALMQLNETYTQRKSSLIT